MSTTLTLRRPNGSIATRIAVQPERELADDITATADAWSELLEAIGVWMGWPREMYAFQVLETLQRLNGDAP